YLAYGIVVVIGAIGLGFAAPMGAFDSPPNPAGFPPLLVAALLIGLVFLYYRSRELTQMFSSVRLGGAALTVKVRARGLVWQHALFGLGLVGSYIVLAIGGVVVLGIVAGTAFAGGQFDLDIFMQHMQGSLITLLAIIFGYLLILAAFSLMAELFLGLGLWTLVARGATITGLDSLRTVRARDEDKALAGEGLADALNVGAY
ncbi:MAG: hypothetical protein ACK4G5_11070, partial [Devosia sp.]